MMHLPKDVFTYTINQDAPAEQAPSAPEPQIDQAALLASALAAHQAQQYEQAESLYRQILQANPGHTHALMNLGALQQMQDRYDEAEQTYRQVLAQDPKLNIAEFNLATILAKTARYPEAETSYRRAIALKPDDHEALSNLGSVLMCCHRYEEAEKAYRRAIAIKADDVESLNNLGNLLKALKCFEEAEAVYKEAIKHNPKFYHAINNLGVHLLSLGRFSEGWPPYEARWVLPRCPPRPFFQPRWLGESTGSGALLVWGEQGIGDEIMYGTMLPDLIRRGHRILLEVDTRLVALFSRSFATLENAKNCQIVGRTLLPDPATRSPDIVCQSPMGGLGTHLRKTAEDFTKTDRPGSHGAYLSADASRVVAYRAKLKKLGAAGVPVIGIAWRSLVPDIGEDKSLKPADLHKLLALYPNAVWVNLQYGEIGAEWLSGSVPMHRLDDVDVFTDIDGLAALLSACDMVVSTSNITAHLAGALGKTTFVLLPAGHNINWYWGNEGDSMPWYQSVKLLRQQTPADWDAPIQALRAELTQHSSRLPASHTSRPALSGDLFGKLAPVVAPLISPEYLQQQQQLHQNPAYGVASLGYAPLVAEIIQRKHIKSLSDYGAGKCRLKEGLLKAGVVVGIENAQTIEYRPYDPVFPEYGPPRTADLVCCIDVLEHIEPDCLAAVIDDLRAITLKLGFFTVHTGPAIKVLSDGRNAHLIQQPMSWWHEKLQPYFEILEQHPTQGGFWLLVQAHQH